MSLRKALFYKAPKTWTRYLPPNELFTPESAESAENAALNQQQADMALYIVKMQGVEVSACEYTVAPQLLRVQMTLTPRGAMTISSKRSRIENSINYALGRNDCRCLMENGLTVEIPTQQRHTVRIRRLFDWGMPKGMDTPLWLGVDNANEPLIIDLAKAPHLLIAGAIGADKSVCINDILASIICTSGNRKTQLMLIDPKQVEFAPYRNHTLLAAPVATTPEAALDLLHRAYQIMEQRYTQLAARGLRSIDEARQDFSRLVIVIDELASLMFTSKKITEGLIENIAAKGRAAGVHLIVATQNPTVKVITGRIKVNIPSRIAFTTASITESRAILDYGGAEKLTGAGDALYKSPKETKLKRFQSALITDKEVHRMNAYDAEHNRKTPPTFWENFKKEMSRKNKNVKNG